MIYFDQERQKYGRIILIVGKFCLREKRVQDRRFEIIYFLNKRWKDLIINKIIKFLKAVIE